MGCCEVDFYLPHTVNWVWFRDITTSDLAMRIISVANVTDSLRVCQFEEKVRRIGD